MINNEAFQEWLGPRGFRTDWVQLRLSVIAWGFPENLFFADGVAEGSAAWIDFFGTYFGKWVTVSATSILLYRIGTQISEEYLFDSPVYLFDVYVPFISDLPEGVWTDLQFKQANGPSMSSLLGVGLVLGLMGLGYYLWKRK